MTCAVEAYSLRVKQQASNLYILVQVQLSLYPELCFRQIYKYRSQYGTYYQVFKVSVKDV